MSMGDEGIDWKERHWYQLESTTTASIHIPKNALDMDFFLSFSSMARKYSFLVLTRMSMAEDATYVLLTQAAIEIENPPLDACSLHCRKKVKRMDWKVEMWRCIT